MACNRLDLLRSEDKRKRKEESFPIRIMLVTSAHDHSYALGIMEITRVAGS